jgi:dipeptidyl aminopeptidase/acylaminoacyl peptidase
MLALALMGCAAQLTDTASLGQPGRYDVTLPGAGVTLGGILFRPAASEAPAPAIIVLHGWGPSGLPGAPRVEPMARRLAELGYVSLALSMRGWPPSGGFDDCGLEQPADIARTADWLASLRGVDPERIGVVGLSQGGQVALLAATRSPRIKVVVAYYAVSDTELWRDTTTFAGIRDSYIPQVCRPGAPRSPVNFADRIGASVLLVHGDADTRVPTEQSLRMQEALRRSGRPVELRLIAGAGHGFQGNESAQAWSSTRDFLARHLAKGQ